MAEGQGRPREEEASEPELAREGSVRQGGLCMGVGCGGALCAPGMLTGPAFGFCPPQTGTAMGACLLPLQGLTRVLWQLLSSNPPEGVQGGEQR